MSQLSATRILNAIYGLFSQLDSTDQSTLKGILWQKTPVAYVTDGGTAGTAQTETAFWVNNTGSTVRVTGIKFVVPVAVTSNDTTYATFTVKYRTSAGASAVTVGSQTTKTSGGGGSGDLTAFASNAIAITAGNEIVPVGGVLTVAVAKASTGVAIAAATSQAYVEVIVEPVS